MEKFIKVILMLFLVSMIAGCNPTATQTSEKKDTSIEKTALVFDTDAGTDDAAAMLLMKNSGIDPDYIIATGGNASADGAVRNTVILKKYLGFSAEAVRGYEIKENGVQNTFHGPDGFAGISEQMIEDYKISEEDLNDYTDLETFKDELKSYDRIDYIVTGPLTTLACLCEDETINEKLDKIYLMGGGINEFNNDHETEFNFSKNPEADEAVLSSGNDITIFTLDLTKQQRLKSGQIDNLEALNNLPEYITLLRYNLKANLEHNEIDATILHDTMPVLYYKDTSKFETEPVKLSVDEYGHTEISEDGYPVTYVKSVEKDLMYRELEDAFKNVKAGVYDY